MEEYTREPCPWRIVDDCGGAFTMGLIGGGVFQTVKGFRNAPSGLSKRMVSDNILKIFIHYFIVYISISWVVCQRLNKDLQ